MPTNHKLQAMRSHELVEFVLDLAAQKGGLKAKASDKRNSAKMRSAMWAAARTIEERLTLLRLDLYRRLGVEVPAEVKHRASFLYLASSRIGRICQGCGSSSYRYLDWYTSDGMPLPLVQAHKGISVETIRGSVRLCKLLCTKCSKRAGAKHTKMGKPLVSHYMR